MHKGGSWCLVVEISDRPTDRQTDSLPAAAFRSFLDALSRFVADQSLANLLRDIQTPQSSRPALKQ